MAIPSQTVMLQIVLKTMAEYSQFSRRQAIDAVCEVLHLSVEEQNQTTSSGAAIYESRTGWAISWLYAAGYVARVKREYTLLRKREDIFWKKN